MSTSYLSTALSTGDSYLISATQTNIDAACAAMASKLLSLGVDPLAKNGKGKDAVTIAEENGLSACVRVIQTAMGSTSVSAV
jgi:hypothetical protein